MRRAIVAVACVVLIATLAAGCNPHPGVTLPVLSIGPLPGGPTARGFERLIEDVRAEGYVPRHVSGPFGSFEVTPHASVPGATIIVQCYADGTVRLRVWGIVSDGRTSETRVPPRLRAEVIELAQALDPEHGGVR